MTRRRVVAIAAALAATAALALGVGLAAVDRPQLGGGRGGAAPAAAPSVPVVEEHTDDHAPMTRPGAINTTLATVTVTGVPVDAAAAAVPPDLSRYVAVDTGDGATDLVLSYQAPATAPDALARAVTGTLPAATVRQGRVTWATATFSAPLAAGAPYVAAIGADPTALGSARSVAELNRYMPGTWQLSVAAGTGHLRLVVHARTRLSEGALARLRALLAREAGAPGSVVSVVGGAAGD